MDNKFSTSQLSELNKMKISSLNHKGIDISIYWFRAVSYSLNKHVTTLRMHHHTFFELHFILDGEITYLINNKTIKVKKNEYILISPMQMHKVLGYSDDYIKLSVALSIPKQNELYDVFNAKNSRKDSISPDMISSISFMLSEASKNAFYSSILIKNRIFEMLCLMAGNIKTNSAHNISEETYDDRLLRAKKYIEDNNNVFLTCNDVAEYCHLSTKQLGRIFEKYEHISLLRYIHDRKIKAAEKLLSENKYTLKEISENLGFSNEYYFNRFFSKHTGMTPGDFRKSQPTSEN